LAWLTGWPGRTGFVCGRYSVARPDTDLAREFDVADVVGEEPEPSWNVAPTQVARVVIERVPRGSDNADHAAAQRMLRSSRWGLVPSWAKDVKIGNRLINAHRSVTEVSVQGRHRTPAVSGPDGWLLRVGENRRSEGALLPAPRPRSAGLRRVVRVVARPRPGRGRPGSVAVQLHDLDPSRPDAVGHIHDRSPVLVPPGELRTRWLDPTLTGPTQVRELLWAIPERRLEPYEVSPAVNSPRNNGPEPVQPVHLSLSSERGTSDSGDHALGKVLATPASLAIVESQQRDRTADLDTRRRRMADQRRHRFGVRADSGYSVR
jgi:putative SOS response-associated peptidase YedK